MTPVDQTLLYERDGFGDCWRACLAAVLDLELREVPGFIVHGELGGVVRDQLEETRTWLSERGLAMQFVGAPWTLRAEDHPNRFVIVCGTSPRGLGHVVVGDLAKPIQEWPDNDGTMRNWINVAHDPHPSRSGLLIHEQAIELVPLDG